MPGYKSNAQSVINALKNQLTGIEDKITKPFIRAVAADVAASNVSRIHNEGKAVDGSKIGDYKEGDDEYNQNSYKTKREKKGKQTQYVDLSFSGKLSKEFQPEAVGDLEIGVGFISKYGSDLSEVLEERYGTKIWGKTEEDERIAQEEYKIRLNNYLNG